MKGKKARESILPPIASISALAVTRAPPWSQNVPLAYLLGIVFTLVAGLLTLVIAEFLDIGVRTKTDVERRLGARNLGTVPEVLSTLGGLRSTESAQDYIVSHLLSPSPRRCAICAHR